MPISSSAAAIEKKRILKVKNKSLTPNSEYTHKPKELLVTSTNAARSIQRFHSTLSAVDVRQHVPEAITIQANADGALYISRTHRERERNPDRICLDRRGLTVLPVIEGESRLRLLSLQHNLVNNLEQLRRQGFPVLVFLDLYDNQVERIENLDGLENLRVLLMGKNRIRKIEGLTNLKRLEVLDLHGNQIAQACGLCNISELKVLNLAGNQIRNIGVSDFEGLTALLELNLRRNRLKKLSGFGNTPNLEKLFVSNNEILTVEDMSSLAKLVNLKELSIENNPVSLAGDCVSFLVSYLQKLTNLNGMQVTDQVRKAAMAWRRNKESTNSTYMDLTSDINVRREEVISNARTNWELIRSQSKCLSTNTSNTIGRTANLKPDNDIILTSLTKREAKSSILRPKSFLRTAILPDKKLNVIRSNSQETENSNSNASASNNEFFRLPPILVPIISKLEVKEGSVKESVSSTGPNVDSSVSSIVTTSHSENEGTSDSTESNQGENVIEVETIDKSLPSVPIVQIPEPTISSENNTETSSNLSTNTSVTISSNNESDGNHSKCSIKTRRSIKSAMSQKSNIGKVAGRAATAKSKKTSSPHVPMVREREQGGDYLIEICGRHLNVYGQAALRFIDKSWCVTKAGDVTTVNFNYSNFNHISGILSKVKHRFPNAENFVFKETNIYCLGQINALAEIQGLTTLIIGKDGNPIYQKDWVAYAVYRLSHWGLKVINGKDITEEDIEVAKNEYQSLSDLVFWSLPDDLLQPLLERLQIVVNNGEASELSPKKWLMSADPALRSVVSKEALQWKKSGSVQEDLMMRQKARCYMSRLLQELCNTVDKLQLFEERWPCILREVIRNTLVDYSQMDRYMKRKLEELK